MELSILHVLQQIHTPWLDAVMIFFTKMGEKLMEKMKMRKAL